MVGNGGEDSASDRGSAGRTEAETTGCGAHRAAGGAGPGWEMEVLGVGAGAVPSGTEPSPGAGSPGPGFESSSAAEPRRHQAFPPRPHPEPRTPRGAESPALTMQPQTPRLPAQLQLLLCPQGCGQCDFPLHSTSSCSVAASCPMLTEESLTRGRGWGRWPLPGQLGPPSPWPRASLSLSHEHNFLSPESPTLGSQLCP